jgi:GNAT superfamily N-acetyltransferase
MYECFPEAFWGKMEPVDQRPSYSTRVSRLTKRLLPTFDNPKLPWMKWVKATYVPKNEMIGMAGWMGPGNPVHNVWCRSAVDFYGFKEHMGWSDDEVDEMWKDTAVEAWDGQFRGDDGRREDTMKGEPHWFLAPLCVWPEYQGKGVGRRLIQWAIDIADMQDPVTPLYLESVDYARAVYMHMGFVPQGKVNLVRRGPAVVRGLEAEGAGEGGGEEKKEIMKTMEVKVMAEPARSEVA